MKTIKILLTLTVSATQGPSAITIYQQVEDVLESSVSKNTIYNDGTCPFDVKTAKA